MRFLYPRRLMNLAFGLDPGCWVRNVSHAAALISLLAGPVVRSADVSMKPTQQQLIDRLIAAMTLDEKLSMLRGGVGDLMGPRDPLSVGSVGYIPGIPRLGIPPLRLTDGPVGIRIIQPTTAVPSPVSLAATFNIRLARAFGALLGREAYDTTNDVLFGPMLNLVRAPQAGRNFETLGEDPFLTTSMGVAETRGIQDEKVIATLKHFAENNQENQRTQVNVNVDERTMREMELPAFEASVKAGAGSIMCAYNQVNGLYSCENPVLLTRILRNEWGFAGWVLSDYGAAKSGVPALLAGLDMEFMSDKFAELKGAVWSGKIPEAAIDTAVRRILTTMDRFGRLNEASPAGAAVIVRQQRPINVEASAKVAREIAARGAVLLKNTDALPLGADDLRSLLIVGPAARELLVSGGGSGHVTGFTDREKSPLIALTEAAGDAAHITYSPGIDMDGTVIPGTAFSAPGGLGPGLLRTDNNSGATQLDPQVNFTDEKRFPPHSNFTWTGNLVISTAGDYDIKIQTDRKEDHAIMGGIGLLSLDGELIAATTPLIGKNLDLMATADGRPNASARVTLGAGVHTIKVVGTTAGQSPFPATDAPLEVRLTWVTPEMRQAALDAAVAAARSAKTVIIFAHDESSETRDRPNLSLPLEQDGLITAIAKANPRTIVVLNTGDPVLMPWVDQVCGILEMWYPGQEGGYSTADILLGTKNPGGKLPVTFPKSAADVPTAAAERYPGINNQEYYSEGIFVGYRWYDAHDIEPLFPFGHGLSYTQFRYSNLKLARSVDGLNVGFRIANVGNREGTEVPQVYIGPPDKAPVPMARRQLAGFTALHLAGGESKDLTIHINRRQLSYWSELRHQWVVPSGSRPIFVGSSSRDLRLQAISPDPEVRQ
jgi:beta-glucosidase